MKHLHIALVIATGVATFFAPHISLAALGVALLAHHGWLQWIEHKATTKLEPYVRKIELLQEAFNEHKEQLSQLTNVSADIDALKNEVQKLSIGQMSRRG